MKLHDSNTRNLFNQIHLSQIKNKIGFDLLSFTKLISRNSKTQVIIVNNQKELSNFFRKNLISNEIIIGMGAGSISRWMRELKFSL